MAFFAQGINTQLQTLAPLQVFSGEIFNGIVDGAIYGIGISRDATLDTDEISSYTTAGEVRIGTRRWGGTRYIFVGVPSATADISDITIVSGMISIFGAFEAYTPVVEGFKWWRTKNPQNRNLATDHLGIDQ